MTSTRFRGTCARSFFCGDARAHLGDHRPSHVAVLGEKMLQRSALVDFYGAARAVCDTTSRSGQSPCIGH